MRISPKFVFAILIFTLAACAQSAAGSQTPEGDNPPVQSAAGDTSVQSTAAPPTEAPTATIEPLPTARPSLPDPAGYTWNIIADGFNRPLLVTHAGDGSGRLFIVEQDGRIWVNQEGVTLPEPFLDIDERVGSDSNEQGLLGLAFHADYEQNGFFFVNYTNIQGDTVVSRFQVSADAHLADAASELVLLQQNQPYANHNGGNIAFGPDGMLYIGFGDGGSQGDPHGNAQSPEIWLGKILRIDVNTGSPYAIPADNPFAAGGGLPEIWALGLRNPWRFGFDSATGEFYVADVGQNQWEEVNVLPAGTAGVNFGWNYFEADQPYEGNPGDLNDIRPVAYYSHDEGGCSVTGGYVYRGTALPAWQGVYFYGDYCSGIVWGLVQNEDGSWQSSQLYNTDFLITSFGVDEAGEIYLVNRGGQIYQLLAATQ
jgi:glucose/arabinose dehydrogenase